MTYDIWDVSFEISGRAASPIQEPAAFAGGFSALQ